MTVIERGQPGLRFQDDDSGIDEVDEPVQQAVQAAAHRDGLPRDDRERATVVECKFQISPAHSARQMPRGNRKEFREVECGTVVLSPQVRFLSSMASGTRSSRAKSACNCADVHPGITT